VTLNLYETVKDAACLHRVLTQNVEQNPVAPIA